MVTIEIDTVNAYINAIATTLKLNGAWNSSAPACSKCFQDNYLKFQNVLPILKFSVRPAAKLHLTQVPVTVIYHFCSVHYIAMQTLLLSQNTKKKKQEKKKNNQ